MMNYWLLLIPVISAFIGWVTNWVAIKMLFHPKQPVKVLGITFQGIFPKRQDQFAVKLGKLVSEQLLSFNDIESKLTNPANLQKMMPMVEQKIDDFLRIKLADTMPMISMFIGDKTIEKLKTAITNELESLFPALIKNYTSSLRQELDLEQIVTEKVKNFSSDQLEDILYQVMAREFKFVEIIGGVLGFLIGLVQVAITLLTA
ncbi:DUF445 family protein [Lacibacter sp. MH-610]|uniref:DUF445 domain-containing protein n=1 Tax=Lacibacter sp. MH-610 TaxID=3020883 RepID=UPI003892A1C6